MKKQKIIMATKNQETWLHTLWHLLFMLTLAIGFGIYSLSYKHDVTDTKAASLSYSEDFTTTNYKDAANTTGNWDTSNGKLLLAKSTWGGKKGGIPGDNLSNTNGTIRTVEYTRDSAGNPIAVWQDSAVNAKGDLLVSKWNGTSWTGLQSTSSAYDNITNVNLYHIHFQFIFDSNDNIHIVFDQASSSSSGSNTDIAYIRWSPNVGEAICGAGITSCWTNAAQDTAGYEIIAGVGSSGSWLSPRIVLDANEKPIVLFDDNTNTSGDLRATRWNGSAWTYMDGITPGFGKIFNTAWWVGAPNVSQDSAKNYVYIAWAQDAAGNNDDDIWFSRWDETDKQWEKMDGTAGYDVVINTSIKTWNRSMELDSNGSPYIAAISSNSTKDLYFTKWTPDSTGAICGAPPGCWTYMDGTTLGFENMTPGANYYGQTTARDLLIDSNDDAHIAFNANNNGSDEIHYARWTRNPALNPAICGGAAACWSGADGTTVGFENITAGLITPSFSDMKLDSSGVPYVMATSGTSPNIDPYIIKYTAGTGWTNLDGTTLGWSKIGSVSGDSAYVNFNFNSSGVPEPAFLDGVSGSQNMYFSTYDVYSDSNVFQSLSVGSGYDTVISATLTANETLNGQTVAYEMTADGTNWCTATSGVQVDFTTCGLGATNVSGTDLRWKATLSTNSGYATPEVNNISIAYETGNSAPTHDTPTLSVNSLGDVVLAAVNLADANGDTIFSDFVRWLINGSAFSQIAVLFDTSTTVTDYAQVHFTTGDLSGLTVDQTGDRNGGGTLVLPGGDAGYLDLGTAQPSTDYYNFTISAWIKVNLAGAGDRPIFRYAHDCSPLFGEAGTGRTWAPAQFYVDAGNLLSFGIYRTGWGAGAGNGCSTGQNWDLYKTVAALPTDTWTHVAVKVSNNTSDSRVVTLYVNGQPQAKTTILDGLSDTGTQSFALQNHAGNNDFRASIGTSRLGLSNYYDNFDGLIDEVYMFNRVLSDEQILSIYNNGLTQIAFEETAAGDTIQGCLTPNDGKLNGPEKCSANLTYGIQLSDSNYSAISNIDLGNTLYLRLYDRLSAGAGSVDAVITTTSGDSETVALAETGPNTGIFQGSIVTSNTSSTAPDAILQGVNGDTITAIKSGSPAISDSVSATVVVSGSSVASRIASEEARCPSLDPITTFDAQVVSWPDKDVVELTWDTAQTVAPDSFKVYRRFGSYPTLNKSLWTLRGTVDGTVGVFTDEDPAGPNAGQTYSYAVEAFKVCGKTTDNPPVSEVSLPVTVPIGSTIDPVTFNVKLKIDPLTDEEFVEEMKNLLQDAQNESATLQNDLQTQKLDGLVAQLNTDATNKLLIEDAQALDLDSNLTTCEGAQAFVRKTQPDVSVTDPTVIEQAIRKHANALVYREFYCSIPPDLTDDEKRVYDNAFADNLFFRRELLVKEIGDQLLQFTEPAGTTNWEDINTFSTTELDTSIGEIVDKAGNMVQTQGTFKQNVIDAGLATLDVATINNFEDLQEDESLKNVVLNVPDIENLIRGHQDTFVLEIWNLDENDERYPTPARDVTINTNVYGEASVNVNNIVAAKYDITIRKPFALRKALNDVIINREVMNLDFTKGLGTDRDAYLKTGDINCDGRIDAQDLLDVTNVLTGQTVICNSNGQTVTLEEADVNGDGDLNLADFLVPFKNWGSDE